MDVSYASILVFGVLIILYEEVKMKYLMSSKAELENYTLYAVGTNINS